MKKRPDGILTPELHDLIVAFRDGNLDRSKLIIACRRIGTRAYNAGYDKGQVDMRAKTIIDTRIIVRRALNKALK